MKIQTVKFSKILNLIYSRNTKKVLKSYQKIQQQRKGSNKIIPQREKLRLKAAQRDKHLSGICYLYRILKRVNYIRENHKGKYDNLA